MKYDFDEIIPRRGTNSYKWDSARDADILPMWVADMDFRTAPPVNGSVEETGGAWYLRICPCTGCILRGGDKLVCKAT